MDIKKMMTNKKNVTIIKIKVVTFNYVHVAIAIIIDDVIIVINNSKKKDEAAVLLDNNNDDDEDDDRPSLG